MLVAAGVIAFIFVMFIAYLALSKGTVRIIRRAAIAALVFIGLAVIFCSLALMFLLGSRPAVTGGFALDTVPVPVENARSDLIPIIVFSLLLFVLVLIIVIVSIREQKRLEKKSR